MFYEPLNSVIKGVVNLLTTELLNTIDFSINDTTNRYYNKDGKSVPRVTEILSSMMHSDRLMYWANSLGFRGIKYKNELERAANAGTKAHSCIENYLKNKIRTDDNIPFLGFIMWEKILNHKGLLINPILIEHRLSCNWFGGTLDALFEIGGRFYVIDFKTSNHVTFKYFLQIAAYIYMLRENGYHVDGAIVLQLDKSEPGFNEYLLDFSIKEHNDFIVYCTQAFFALVYAYYNIKRVENEYKNIFKEV